MPIRSSKDSEGCFYQWGTQGFKYHYDCNDEKAKANAKENAIKQGVAIGDLEKLQRISELARTRVSFDYDGTITQSKIKDIVKNLTTAGGTEVFIISSRENKASMYALATQLGIPQFRVFATGSNEKKIEKIKELRIKTHYDDNIEVVRGLPGVGKLI